MVDGLGCVVVCWVWVLVGVVGVLLVGVVVRVWCCVCCGGY